MNTYSSNGKSISIISVFIDDTLDVTNKYGITNSNPSDSKLDKVSKLLNAPLRKVIHATVYFVMAIIIAFLVNFVLENKMNGKLDTNELMSDFFYMYADISIPVRTGYVYGYLKVKKYLEKNNLRIKDILNKDWRDILYEE